MIGWLAGILVSRFGGLALEQARRYVIIALVVVGLVLLGIAGCVAKSRYDASVVDRARIEDNAKAIEGRASADAKAGNTRQGDALRAQAEQREVKEAIENAQDPAAARRAYYLCVRLQQSARAAGRPAPACQ